MKDKEKEKKGEGEPKLVTVAVQTRDRALILKTILESEGIPAYIHAYNLIEPTISGNVRVRISEKDLSRALQIIERVDFSASETERKSEQKQEVLIPVDFSDYTMKACEFGFKLAADIHCEVKLFHTFFTAYNPVNIPFSNAMTVVPYNDLYVQNRTKAEEQMKGLRESLTRKIAEKQLPDLFFTVDLVEGLAEEEIISYSKKYRPRAVVMGTRGGNAREDFDLIGSVTAETIEGCQSPVFAIPENSKNQDIAQMKNVVFLTNFREREFNAFETMMEFLKEYPIKVHVTHIAKKEDIWNEMKLSGIKEYLKEKYPKLETELKLIDQSSPLEVVLDGYVKEQKIDMIAMSGSRRSNIARIFNPGIARKMLFHSDTPLLVIKG